MILSSTPIVFLDIDGVLIAYPHGDERGVQFTPHCLEVFRSILDADPGIRVVFSTTWRLGHHANRLHEQWVASGLNPEVCIDGTPDLSEDFEAHRANLRGKEIEAWLQAHPNRGRWVVIDDDRMGIEPILDSRRCVFTNPQLGLQRSDAARVGQILDLACTPWG